MQLINEIFNQLLKTLHKWKVFKCWSQKSEKNASGWQSNCWKHCGSHVFINFSCNKVKWQFWGSSPSSPSSQNLKTNNWITMEKFEYLSHFLKSIWCVGGNRIVFKTMHNWYWILFFRMYLTLILCTPNTE